MNIERLNERRDYIEKERVRITNDKSASLAKNYLSYDLMLQWSIRDIEKKLKGAK